MAPERSHALPNERACHETWSRLIVSWIHAQPSASQVADVRWVKAEEFSEYEFPDADQRTVDLLLTEL